MQQLRLFTIDSEIPSFRVFKVDTVGRLLEQGGKQMPVV
jgi:hypothetical protein